MQRKAGLGLNQRRGAGPSAPLPYLAVMRTALIALILGNPVQAWEFTPGLPCLLTAETEAAEITLTYDPTQPLYTLTIRQAAPFTGADVFAMRFDGPSGLTISTDRHTLSADGRALSVADTGFGNVLNGLQFNDTAWALLGDQAIAFPLETAAEPVAAFRLCEAAAGA